MIDVDPSAAPSPGSVSPGDLYVDLASRQIWLGVNTTINPDGAVLVSDMLALDAAIDQSLLDSKAYTLASLWGNRSGTPAVDVNGYAGRVHTHTSSQVTDFNAAVDARIAAAATGGSGTPVPLGVPIGTIVMFSGNPAIIGSGDWVSWHVCDGTLLTIPGPPSYQIRCPDLRDKFVIGNGTWSVNMTNVSPTPPGGTFATGTATSFNTGPGGGHTPVINPIDLQTSHMPYHQHGPGTFAGVTDSKGAHQHTVTISQPNILEQVASGGLWTMVYPGSAMISITATGTTNNTGNHTHGVDVNSGLSAPAGGGNPYTPTAKAVADHTHNITGAQLRTTLPFYSLAFAIKVT